MAEAISLNGYVIAEQEINSEAYPEIINSYGLGSGRISYSDFLIATLDWKSLIETEALWGAFCNFDKDRDGKISIEDVKLALISAGCSFTDEDFDFLTFEFLQTHQSKLNFEEFKNLLLLFSEDNQVDSSPLLVRKRTFNPDIAMSRATSYEPFVRAPIQHNLALSYGPSAKPPIQQI